MRPVDVAMARMALAGRVDPDDLADRLTDTLGLDEDRAAVVRQALRQAGALREDEYQAVKSSAYEEGVREASPTRGQVEDLNDLLAELAEIATDMRRSLAEWKMGATRRLTKPEPTAQGPGPEGTTK